MNNTKKLKNIDTLPPIGKEEFIRLLADKNGFSLKDNKDFLETLTFVLKYCVVNRQPFAVREFGNLNFFPIKAHQGVNPKKNERIEIPEGEKVIFTLAASIRKPFEYFDDDEVIEQGD